MSDVRQVKNIGTRSAALRLTCAEFVDVQGSASAFTDAVM